MPDRIGSYSDNATIWSMRNLRTGGVADQRLSKAAKTQGAVG